MVPTSGISASATPNIYMHYCLGFSFNDARGTHWSTPFSFVAEGAQHSHDASCYFPMHEHDCSMKI